MKRQNPRVVRQLRFEVVSKVVDEGENQPVVTVTSGSLEKLFEERGLPSSWSRHHQLLRALRTQDAFDCASKLSLVAVHSFVRWGVGRNGGGRWATAASGRFC